MRPISPDPAGSASPSASIACSMLTIATSIMSSVGYELLKLGARYRSNPVVRVIMWPGILVQMITTKQPTDDMIEVAIVAMEEALRADGESIPEGSDEMERYPMVLGAAAPVATIDGAAPAGDAAPAAEPATSAVAADPPSAG